MGRLSKYANRYDIKARAREIGSISHELVDRARQTGEQTYAAVGRTLDAVRKDPAEIGHTIRRNPVKTLLIGIAAGYALSRLLSRKRSS